MISGVSIGLALGAGFLTVLSPCVLPVVPILVGRSLQSNRYGPLALMAGLVGSFAVLGSLLGVSVSWFADLASVLRTVAIIVLLVMGILAIFPELAYKLFGRLRLDGWLKQPERVGLMGEFWLGTQLGLVWTPCAGPVLAGILTLAVANDNPLTAFGLLVTYALGAALPMLVIAYGGRYLSGKLLGLRAHAESLQRVGGVLVAASAVAILLGWDMQIQLLLAPFFLAPSL